MYSKVHLFFSSEVDDEALSILAPHPVAHRVATCCELNLEFAPIDSHAFILSSELIHRDTVFRDLYTPRTPEQRDDLLEASASGVFTALCALGSLPKSVRWMKGNKPLGAGSSGADEAGYNSADELAERVATRVGSMLEETRCVHHTL